MLLICTVAIILIMGAILLFFLNIASYIIVQLCLLALAVYGISTLISLVKRRHQQRIINLNTPKTIDISCRCGQIFRAAAPASAQHYTICCPYCGTQCHVTLNRRNSKLTDRDKRSIVISIAGIIALLLLLGMRSIPHSSPVRYYQMPDSYHDYNIETAPEDSDII